MLNRRIFGSAHTTTLRPLLACEITPSGVVAARQEPGPDETPVTAFAALAPGDLTPGLATPNLVHPERVAAALRGALDAVVAGSRTLTLVVPDSAVRVLVLDFDTLPDKQSEALPLMRFRLRKLLPFDVDQAAVSYQRLVRDGESLRVLVAVTPTAVLAEYEAAVREAGYEPGAVLPSTLAALAALPDSGNALVVNRNGDAVTTAITRDSELLLHRTLELPEDPASRIVELQQVVTVAMAYFEDTLHTPAETLLSTGAGGAAELKTLLEEAPIAIRDLAPAALVGSTGSMPTGLVAGVMGALNS